MATSVFDSAGRLKSMLSAPVIVDLYANRPSASTLPTGVRFFATDKGLEWVVSGGAWLLVGGEQVSNAVRAAASSTLLSTSYVDFFTVTLTPGRAYVSLDYYFVYSNDNSGLHRTIDVRVQADGVTVGQERTLDSLSVAGASTRTTAVGVHKVTVTADASHTFVVQAKASAGGSVSLREGELIVRDG